MDQNTSRARKIAYLGLAAALAILVGYVEALIPFNFGIPGMKLGLSNIVLLIMLYHFGFKEAIGISAIRVVVVGFLFGNPFSIAYGMAGAIVSMIVMGLLMKTNRFSPFGLSAAGGVSHNFGQVAVAYLVLPGLPVFWYLPLLMLSGLVTGIINGLIVYEVDKRLPHQLKDRME